MTLDRRRFVQITAAGVLASLTTTAWASDAVAEVGALDRPELLTMLGPDRVREIGTRYRAVTPSENILGSLRDAISNTERRTLLHRWSPRWSIENQIRNDFAAGRTVLVDGWVLSATEARQCALFSLASS
jgi:hypothetical protein